MKVRCNNCMKVFDEKTIIYDGDWDQEFCPHCGESGCLMDLKETNHTIEIPTSFGIVYIEKWEPECREEEDRVKLYDSNGNYLDYFSTESFYETGLSMGIGPEDYYELICSEIGELSSVHEFMDYLGLNYEVISKNPQDITNVLVGQNVDDDSPLEENEWVNHIGDYWILIAE